jgi:hypothetical protein
MNMDQRLLVWVQGTRGPTPQKWHTEFTSGTDRTALNESNILSFHHLDNIEAELPLNTLARKYPPPCTLICEKKS